MLAKDKNKEKDAVLKMKEGNTEEEGVEKANWEKLETVQNIRLKQDSNMT